MMDDGVSAAGREYLAIRLAQATERARRRQEAANTLRFELMAAKTSDEFALPRSLAEKSGRCRLDLVWSDAEVEIALSPEGFSRMAGLVGRDAELRSLASDAIRYRFRFDKVGEARIVLERSTGVERALQDFVIVLDPKD